MTSWGFLYQKHLPKTLGTRAAFAWYVVGVFVAAAVAGLAERTPAPLRSERGWGWCGPTTPARRAWGRRATGRTRTR